MTDQDRRMTAILLKLEMLASGSVQAWNASGGGQDEPDDKVVNAVIRGDEPLHLHYRKRYAGAYSIASREAVIVEADELAKAWACRPEATRKVADAVKVSVEELIVEDHKGQSAEVVAFQFNMHPDNVRRIRKKAKVSTEDGRGLLSPAPVEDKAAKAQELSRGGMSTRTIAETLGVSQSAVMKWIRRAAA